MAYTEHYRTRFEPDGIYHVYNRAVDRKPLFVVPDNRRYFLQKLKHHTSSVLDVYAYNLLGNHFHLLVRVKSETGLTHRHGPITDVHRMVSNAFRKLFQTYTLAFNQQQGRIGTLFQTPFKRATIPNDEVLIQELWYVHANAVLHGMSSGLEQWPHSSFAALCSDKPTSLLRDTVWQLFGSREAFIQYHKSRQQDYLNDQRYWSNFFFEDD
jgi:REP element-mobilizing transposase RayT